ncbi:MAG: hypothetical protein KGP28_02780 [Bdellovibrionales bacterium]|nr:hypothetical protein [Bdellovibrionales bacterium]
MLRRAPLILFVLSLLVFQARADASTGFTLPSLKEKSVTKRINEAKTWIRKEISEARNHTSSEPDLLKLGLLYFLESHLETLEEVSFQCKNQKSELNNCIERSLPRNASPDELSDSHLKALQELFFKLCPAPS